MDYGQFVEQVAAQADALRAAAVAAGPDAPTPTCPEWTVQDLVRHMAQVHGWARKCLLADPDGERPAMDEPPAPWEDLLAWWDERRATLIKTMQERGPDAPAWVFGPPPSASFWVRRQAHETAIHRLDAEHAAAGSNDPDAVPTLVYEPEFAADGVDEALYISIYRLSKRQPPSAEGTVLFHAADAGRAWLVRVRPGEPVEIGPVEHPAIDADASVVGTADAVYRAAWGRPSHAVKGGDLTLISALRSV